MAEQEIIEISTTDCDGNPVIKKYIEHKEPENNEPEWVYTIKCNSQFRALNIKDKTSAEIRAWLHKHIPDINDFYIGSGDKNGVFKVNGKKIRPYSDIYVLIDITNNKVITATPEVFNNLFVVHNGAFK